MEVFYYKVFIFLDFYFIVTVSSSWWLCLHVLTFMKSKDSIPWYFTSFLTNP